MDFAHRPGVEMYRLTSTLCPQSLSLSYFECMCTPSGINLAVVQSLIGLSLMDVEAVLHLSVFFVLRAEISSFNFGLNSSCLIEQSNTLTNDRSDVTQMMTK